MLSSSWLSQIVAARTVSCRRQKCRESGRAYFGWLRGGFYDFYGIHQHNFVPPSDLNVNPDCAQLPRWFRIELHPQRH